MLALLALQIIKKDAPSGWIKYTTVSFPDDELQKGLLPPGKGIRLGRTWAEFQPLLTPLSPTAGTFVQCTNGTTRHSDPATFSLSSYLVSS